MSVARQGTKYEHFIDELMEYEVEYTYRYMDSIGCESIKSGLVTEDFIHMIGTAYFNGMFEVVRHDMSHEQAKNISVCSRFIILPDLTPFFIRKNICN